MRNHSMVAPQFWTGDTGRYLRQWPDAQRLALYLITCPSANMIGLYYLPLPTICHELGMTKEGARKALQRVLEGGFACYDEASEVVFVRQMARFQVGNELKPTDKRVAGVERLLESYRKSIFFNEFLSLYSVPFNLRIKPNSEAPPKPLPSPIQDTEKPLRSQEQEQEQNQDQEQDKKESLPKAFDPRMVSFPAALDTPHFRDAWGDWCKHRTEIKSKLTPTSVKQQLNELSGWGIDRATAAIRHTIARGWIGIREPDAGFTGKSQDAVKARTRAAMVFEEPTGEVA